MMKRLVDVVGAVLGLALITPLTPFIAIAIKLDSKGPVLVTLDRVSNGKLIKVYKFRSMIHNAHSLKKNLLVSNERNDGPFFKMRHDPRLTRVGKTIRRFRWDEFPQLINVLKGELSLVGPRPHEPIEIVQYPGKYQKIILSKAGVTGLSQVNGASSLPFLKELEYDLHYIEHKNFWMDMKIIMKTLSIIFFDSNAV